MQPDQQISTSLPLVRETMGFLNNLPDSKLESIVINSVLTYLNTHPRSMLLFPCLQTACRCLNQMTSAVMIIECCITTRFNIGNNNIYFPLCCLVLLIYAYFLNLKSSLDLQDPSDAQSIWQLILVHFQVPTSMTDEFIHASVNKNAFLTLYCYVLDRIPKTTPEGKKLLLNSLIEWIQKCDVK